MPYHPVRICIVDDEPERSRGWATTIKSFEIPKMEVVALEKDESRELMRAVVARQHTIRTTHEVPEGSSPLQGFDVLVVDYDLQELLEEGQWSTGLQVLALARAFSDVKLIVLVNQFGSNTFDLTLTKSVRSLADLDVGSDQLVNPAFWDQSRASGFAPWAWGDGVLGAVTRIEQAIAWAKLNLDRPVLKCLGFTHTSDQSNTSTYLSGEIWQQCLTEPDHTLRDMVRASDFLTQKDRDNAIVKLDEPCARVAAVLIMHWLDRWVVPANEVLADLPHLVSFYPWLLRDNANAAGWQAAASLTDGFAAVHTDVGRYTFEPGFLVSRPVVWKHKVLEDAALSEPKGFSYEGIPDLVFCEDTSSFVEFTNAKPFTSRLPGADPQRFVVNQEKLGELEVVSSPAGVAYEPSVLFAL